MTDAGGFPPKPERVGTAERERLLRQIATALDLPVTAFARKLPSQDAEEPSSAECSALLGAFRRIRDPQMRSFCLQVLETFAQR